MEPQRWFFHTPKVNACSPLFPLLQFFYYFYMPSLSVLKVFMFFFSIICSFSCFIFKYLYFSLYTSIFLVFGDFNDVFKKDELFLYWASSAWPASALNFVISIFFPLFLLWFLIYILGFSSWPLPFYGLLFPDSASPPCALKFWVHNFVMLFI